MWRRVDAWKSRHRQKAREGMMDIWRVILYLFAFCSQEGIKIAKARETR